MRAALLGVVTSSLHERASGFVDPLDEHEGVASAKRGNSGPEEDITGLKLAAVSERCAIVMEGVRRLAGRRKTPRAGDQSRAIAAPGSVCRANTFAILLAACVSNGSGNHSAARKATGGGATTKVPVGAIHRELIVQIEGLGRGSGEAQERPKAKRSRKKGNRRAKLHVE